jgi:hypothetical protein
MNECTAKTYLYIKPRALPFTIAETTKSVSPNHTLTHHKQGGL